ncbi:hypothetical protein DV515_00019849 [Chloebia gouldiae]|uniref:Uncharacterized protein n=1 Tax=Chloebia gouldiae TaxID=44316 RepID=A0A3L8Q3I7_CHLGU|nr:hypothetical protein DV515_00019849 [Chloebia gouldiae]
MGMIFRECEIKIFHLWVGISFSPPLFLIPSPIPGTNHPKSTMGMIFKNMG